MKKNRYQKRFYRDWGGEKDLRSTRIVVKETDLQIFTDKAADKDFVRNKVSLYRRQIEEYISKERSFLTSLKPIPVELSAAPIVREMARQAKKAGVGPMAAVAGAIAQFLGKQLLKRGCREVIIENGGDIFLATKKTRRVAIFSGRSKLWQGLSLKINPADSPVGICTSSGKIGHSLSFGSADSVVILSRNAALADAAATACGNLINSKKDLQKAIDSARRIKGVRGAVLILKNNLITWGKVEFAR
ncbi:UPF0280 family protein [Candidatus Omnitrophota bacterium]